MTSPLHFVGLSERHLGHLIRVGANLELADLKNLHWSNELKEQSYWFTWVSRGKLSNLMGQMKLMWVAWEYMISLSLVIHRPACFDNTSTTCTQVHEVLWKYSKIIHDCIFSQFPATTVFPCDPVQKWSNKPIGISCIYEGEIFYSDQE